MISRTSEWISLLIGADKPSWRSIFGCVSSVVMAVGCWLQTSSFIALCEPPSTEWLREHIQQSEAIQARIRRESSEEPPDHAITYIYFEEKNKRHLNLAIESILSDGELETILKGRFGISLRDFHAVILPAWEVNSHGEAEMIGLTQAGWSEVLDSQGNDSSITIRDRPSTTQRTIDGIPRIVLRPKAFVDRTETKRVLFHEILHAMNIPGYRPYSFTRYQSDLAYLPEYRWYVAKENLEDSTDLAFVILTFVFVALFATNVGVLYLRRREQRSASRSLLKDVIASLKVKTVLELSDSAERLTWTTDLPNNRFVQELTSHLARFEQTALYAGQYLTLNSPYLKLDALTRAINETEALQRTLESSPLESTPLFLRRFAVLQLLEVTGDWRKLLNSEREKQKAFELANKEIPNPFFAGNVVEETPQNVFTGRRDIVSEIEESLLGATQAPMVLLYGPRRMGKTSILYQLPRLLGSHFVPVVVDGQHPNVSESLPSLLRYLSKRITDALRRRRIDLEPLADASMGNQPFAAFDDWFDAVEGSLPEGTRILLCLDEYERLQASLEKDWGESVLNLLRNMVQHRPKFALMFTGVHKFQELGSPWIDRFVNARRVRVSFLSREDVLPLLTQPIPEFDMTYAPGAIDSLIAATSCQPFLTQATAFELVRLLNKEKRKEATPLDVERAIEKTLETAGEYFAGVWQDAGPNGQTILRNVVNGKPAPPFPEARLWLRENDVLTNHDTFAVEMMRRWVENLMRNDIPGERTST